MRLKAKREQFLMSRIVGKNADGPSGFFETGEESTEPRIAASRQMAKRSAFYPLLHGRDNTFSVATNTGGGF
jgi:hypothetical protein